MAKTKKGKKSSREALARDRKAEAAEQELLTHVFNLGLDSVEAYQAWCRERDLGEALYKSDRQRDKEIERHRAEASNSALRRGRRLHRRPGDTIAALFAGQLGADDLSGYLGVVDDRAAHLQDSPDARNAFRDLLLAATRTKADLFDVETPAISRFPAAPGNTWIGGLAALATRHDRWLQSPDTWRREKHGARRQFGSLARHLLAKYELPSLFDAAFFTDTDGERQRHWFEHLGAGGNLRTAPDLPVTLTKRMAHEVRQAPAHYTIPQALRYGQILGQDGSPPLVDVVLATRLGQSFEQEDFWSTFLHWLTRHPMLDGEWIGPIADYLHERRFVPQEDGPPPEPNLSMKSRSVDKLLRQVEEWHLRRTRDQRVPTNRWEPCGIGEYVENGRNEETGQLCTWTVRELTTSKQLLAEGKAMSHCVRSYGNNCRSGRKAVFSVQRDEVEGRLERMLTIAVRPDGRRIIQARGKNNSVPVGRIVHQSKKSMNDRYRRHLRQAGDVMRRWQQQEGLEGYASL